MHIFTFGLALKLYRSGLFASISLAVHCRSLASLGDALLRFATLDFAS